MRVLYHLPRILELNVIKVNIFNAYSSHSSCRLSVVSCRLSVISCELSKVVFFPEMAKKQREHLLTKAPSHDNICCIPFFRSGNQWLAPLYCYCP